MRRMIALVLLLTVGPCAVHGQSIVISGGNRSIVISGKETKRSQAVVSVPSVPEPQKGVDPVVSRPAPVVVDHSRREAPAGAVSRSIRLQQWGATWCPACPAGRAQAQQAADQLGIRLEYFDYDQNKQVAQSLGVNSVPQTHVVVDGRVLYRYVGQTHASTIAAKARELSGATNIQMQARHIQTEVPGRFVVYGGTTYDMETWRRMCSLRNCGMCQYLDSMQSQYRANKAAMSSPQSSSSPDVVDEAIGIMQLTPSDVVAELGCGDGKAAIQMVKQSGCRVEGYENDPNKVAEARRNVIAEGLADRITIHEKDVVGLKLPESTTAIYAFLYPELLAKIRPQLMTGRVAVCPGHKPEGIDMSLVGQCWVRKSI